MNDFGYEQKLFCKKKNKDKENEWIEGQVKLFLLHFSEIAFEKNLSHVVGPFKIILGNVNIFFE